MRLFAKLQGNMRLITKYASNSELHLLTRVYGSSLTRRRPGQLKPSLLAKVRLLIKMSPSERSSKVHTVKTGKDFGFFRAVLHEFGLLALMQAPDRNYEAEGGDVSRQTYTRVLQCSPASVGLALARPRFTCGLMIIRT